MPTTTIENKSQKSLLDARLRGCRHDLTNILALDPLQIVQFLNTPLSKYEHNRPFLRAYGAPAKNTNLLFKIKKALFTNI